MEDRIKKLEKDMTFWKKAHIKLQEQHMTLQKAVYGSDKK